MSLDSPKFLRTIRVSDIPNGITESKLKIYFQKKKNRGGEVEEVILPSYPDVSEALVVFEDAAVAQNVVTREHIIDQKPVKVSLEGQQVSVVTRTILVSDLPDGISENNVHIYFQKKKNGGGEIQRVEIFPEQREARVTFEDANVAQNVTQREHVIQNCTVKVELQKREKQESQKILPKEERTVEVSNLPNGVTENYLHIYFQRKKNGGGEIEKVKLLPEKKMAIVIFEEPEVAHRVTQREHVIQGSTVKVELQESEIQEMDQPKKNRAILVTDLPKGITEQKLKIYFQKKKNGGGEIKAVKLSQDGQRAIVTFEDLEVAPAVINRVHVIQEKRVKIKALEAGLAMSEKVPEKLEMAELTFHPDNKHKDASLFAEGAECHSNGWQGVATFRDSRANCSGVRIQPPQADKVTNENNHEVLPPKPQFVPEVPSKTKEEMPLEKTILVSEIPQGIEETQVLLYFQRKNNGGGEIETVKMFSEERKALVVFVEAHVAENVLRREHVLHGKLIKVEKFNPQSEKTEVTFVFTKVTATINPTLFHTIDLNLWKNILDKTQETTGIQWHDSAFGMLLTGTLEQVKEAEMFLHLKLLEEYSEANVTNVSYNLRSREKIMNDQNVSQNHFPIKSSPDVHGDGFSRKFDSVTNSWSSSSLSSSDRKRPQKMKEPEHLEEYVDQNISVSERTNYPSGPANVLGEMWDLRKPSSQAKPDKLDTRNEFNEKETKPTPSLQNITMHNNDTVQAGSETPDESKHRRDCEEPSEIENEERSSHPASMKQRSSASDPQARPTPAPRQTRRPTTEDQDFTQSFDQRSTSRSKGTSDRRTNAANFLSLQEEHSPSMQPQLGETAQKPGLSNLNQATSDKLSPDDKFQKDDTSYKKQSADNEDGKNALLNETHDSQEQMNLREEPSSVTVAKFIQHVYKEDLESFKSQNRVDVVLSDDRKTLTLKPMCGFNPSVMDEAARKLQQFYETTSKNLKRDVIDLKEFSADDAEKVKRGLARQRGRSDVMVEESSPDVFILVGDAENVEMFRKNVMNALRKDIPHSEESKIPTKPMVASRKGTRVIFAFGELHKEQCDAMVNFTDEDLVHKSGLSCAIREAAGEEFWKACRDIISKNGSLFPYMVTTTTAGTLPCRLVIHAILPNMSEQRQEVLRHGLQEVCRQVFTHAKENDVKSICFPIITPDIFNLSPAVSSRLLFDIIKEYIDKSRPLDGKLMEEIRIVYRKQSRCVEDYVKEYTKQF